MNHLDNAALQKIVADKGPVCLCPGRDCYGQLQYCGPQRAYQRAQALLRYRGVPLPAGASTARSHALDCGEGRGEWDRIMTKAGWG